MKVISLLQPWASLVVLGHKKIETRSWDTPYRGPLLIHASKRWDANLSLTISKINAYELLCQAGYEWDCLGKKTTFPLGAIIDRVELITTFPVEMLLRSDADGIYFNEHSVSFTEQEKAFGDYSDGRYGWLLSRPMRFDKPLPCKATPGLWNFELPEPIVTAFVPQTGKPSTL